MEDKSKYEGKVLRKASNWKELYFYQKANTLYQLTFAFCERFLPKYGDRTVDQMVQAARSGKQNIIEGSEDGKTSTEMELKLLNVARSSIGELCEDYQDHIVKHHLPFWDNSHPRYGTMLTFTQQHNALEDYEPYFAKWSEEEMANIGLTLCHQVDAMMNGASKSECMPLVPVIVRAKRKNVNTLYSKTNNYKQSLLESKQR